MSYESYNLWAKEVLLLESEALHKNAHSLSPGFADAALALTTVTGKIIFTGLGKSGCVAQKIAATFSSTGTPSCFLHPTEALHGDLGMIATGDAIIAVAHGGETFEVLEVVKYARRRDIKIVCITGYPQSTLGQLSDHIISYSVGKEACPLGLAPTTSTTMAMALGDALAVCLMRAKGISEENFAGFHPGGSIGRKLSLVKDHMHSIQGMPQLSPHDEFSVVLENLTKNNFGLAAVLSPASDLMGIITDGDLRRAIIAHKAEVFGLNANKLMTKSPKVVFETTPSLEAVKLMEQYKITALMVVSSQSSKKLLGVIRLHDLLAAKIV